MKGSRAVEKEVRLKTPYITLGQLLKIENIISSGGQAKYFLEEHADEIFVNGEHENRRGRKLYPGDEVVLADQGKFVMKTGERYAPFNPQTEKFSQLSRNKA